jgi:dTDP-4-amino-4,6-dideoxygalactose transaminase
VAILFDKKAIDVMRFFNSKNIETRTFFYPLHKQPCFVEIMKDQYCDACVETFGLKCEMTCFEKTQKLYDHGVCVPSYPELEEDQIKYICNCIKELICEK